MVLQQWKGFAEYLLIHHGFKITVKTLKRWHKEIKPIPFLRKLPGKTGWVYIEDGRKLWSYVKQISH